MRAGREEPGDGGSRARLAPAAYRGWEARGHAPDKMADPRDGWEENPQRPGWGWRVHTPSFIRPMVEKGASIKGTWRPVCFTRVDRTPVIQYRAG
ncbi:hypothetical protein SRO_0260 [Streptomyces rochei]|nr:hypothetical protein SRO_0260 [Streptomyces rochei]